MSEALAETTTTETTPPTETPLANTAEARTEDGTIKDQSTTLTSSTEPTTNDKPADKLAESGAPETYADFTMPEGRTLSKDTMAEALPIFKELNLNQDQAQKLIDFATKNQISTEQAGQAAYNAMRDGWRNEVLKDTTLSSGTDLKPEVKESIGRAVDSLGPELGGKFREVMNTTGLGDNPTFVKAMFEMSKFVTEGRPVKGGGPSPAGQSAPGAKPPSIASAMFPKLK